MTDMVAESSLRFGVAKHDVVHYSLLFAHVSISKIYHSEMGLVVWAEMSDLLLVITHCVRVFEFGS